MPFHFSYESDRLTCYMHHHNTMHVLFIIRRTPEYDITWNDEIHNIRYNRYNFAYAFHCNKKEFFQSFLTLETLNWFKIGSRLEATHIHISRKKLRINFYVKNGATTKYITIKPIMDNFTKIIEIGCIFSQYAHFISHAFQHHRHHYGYLDTSTVNDYEQKLAYQALVSDITQQQLTTHISTLYTDDGDDHYDMTLL